MGSVDVKLDLDKVEFPKGAALLGKGGIGELHLVDEVQ